MKIFNEENGVKKVYVQLNDIMMMMHLDSLIPSEVFDKVFSDVFIVTDENRFEFKEFVEPGTVEFFEGCDWIPDFKQYKNMSFEEFVNDGQEMADEQNEIADKWNAMNVNQRKNNQKLLTRYERLEHKLKSCGEILHTKRGLRVMPFPVVPDSDGFKVNNDDCIYMAQQGLNPLQVLVFRKDGKAMDRKNEILPVGLIQAAESILINDNLEHNEYFDEIESTRSLSEDNKYFIMTFKIIPKDLDVEEKLEDQMSNVNDNSNVRTSSSNPNKPKSLIKRITDWIMKKSN